MSEESLEKVENKQKKRLFGNLFVRLKKIKHFVVQSRQRNIFALTTNYIVLVG